MAAPMKTHFLPDSFAKVSSNIKVNTAGLPHWYFAKSLCKRSFSVTTLIFYANAGEITTYLN